MHRARVFILSLIAVALLPAGAESYRPVFETRIWTFPANGVIPPNVEFLISLNEDFEDHTPELLRARDGLFVLIDQDGHETRLEITPGPVGSAQASPSRALKTGALYRLKLIPSDRRTSPFHRRLAEAAQRKVWRVTLPEDHAAPEWKGSVKITGMAETRLFPLQRPAPQGHDLELHVETPVEDQGPVLLLWTSAPLEHPDRIELEWRRLVKRGDQVLCCFPRSDRIVRFRARDAAGNVSKPSPSMLAFGTE